MRMAMNHHLWPSLAACQSAQPFHGRTQTIIARITHVLVSNAFNDVVTSISKIIPPEALYTKEILRYNMFVKVLAIDYGEKNVGIAISDEMRDFAFPKAVLKNDKNLVQNIVKICEESGVDEIVIGDSKDFKMKDNEIMKMIRPFKEVLEKVSRIKVYYEPEFMTSAQAERIQGKNEMLDASSAALILKSYLEKQKIKND